MKKNSKEKRIMRHKRVRSKIFGSATRPRLALYRSHKHIFLQLIDDDKKKTILGFRDDALLASKKKRTKLEASFEAGKSFAEHAKEKGIKEVVFDRGGFRYQGRIQKVAEGAREGGLKF